MAVQEIPRSTHGGTCTCDDCPHGAREGHRRAVAAFLEKREEFAAGQGLKPRWPVPPGRRGSGSPTS